MVVGPSELDTPSWLFDNAAMEEGLIIEGISFQGRCGVSLKERSQPQPLLVNLEFACPAKDAIETDTLSKTIDYAQVSSRVLDIGRSEQCALLETLADRICRILLAEFPIDTLHIWLRKVQPPLEHVVGSVGVRLTYHRAQTLRLEKEEASVTPSPFFLNNVHWIPQGQVLDLACGGGRHALHLARLGYQVIGLDRNTEALDTLSKMAREDHLTNMTIKNLDLERDPNAPPSLGENAFDGVVVFYYLYRPLFPSILKALKPGGTLIYETFLIDNHHQFQHPRRKEFCLEHNELLQLADGLRVLHYAEGQHQDPSQTHQAFTARLVAQKIED